MVLPKPILLRMRKVFEKHPEVLMRIRVVAAQMRVTEDVASNRDTILRAIDFAAAEKAIQAKERR